MLSTCSFVFFLLASLASTGFCAKILVYSPSISNSHLVSNGRIADLLVKNGHEVVMFIPEMISYNNINGTKLARIVRMNNLSTALEDLFNEGDDVFTIPAAPPAYRYAMEEALIGLCEALLKRKEELEALRAEKFDLAFTEMFDHCGLGVVRALGIKTHIWLSTTPLHDFVSIGVGVPSPLSYVPVVEENYLGPKMGFWERANNVYEYFIMLRLMNFGVDKKTALFRKYLDSSFPDLHQVASESTLAFVNSDEFLDAARPILHKTIYMGGLGIGQPKALEEPFASWMQKGKKGVILFSFGTMAPSSVMPVQMRKDIFATFAAFADYHFIFKADKADHLSYELAKDVPNVDVSAWLPQADILGHPRLQLFAMHGGFNGLLESAIRGVPVVVIPLFLDQLRNAKLAEYRGIGYALEKTKLNKETLSEALRTVLEDEKYKKASVRLAKLVKNKPFTPEERFLQWTNFVAEHGELPELDVEGARMGTIEYFCLDVIGAFVFAVIATLYVLYKSVSKLLRALLGRSLLKGKVE